VPPETVRERDPQIILASWCGKPVDTASIAARAGWDRISAVKGADEILVLDEGRVIERGNHEELVHRGGVYAELYLQQRLTEELEQI